MAKSTSIVVLSSLVSLISACRISGTITLDGVGIEGVGVIMTFQSGESVSTTTDADGAYAFENVSEGVYTITPIHDSYVFDPNQRVVTVSDQEVSGVDFQASIPLSPVDVLIFTTTRLVKDAAFNNDLNSFRTALYSYDNLTSAYVEVDSDECLSTYGIKANNTADWKEIMAVIRAIKTARNPRYFIILGGSQVVPVPIKSCPGTYTPPDLPVYDDVPTDNWYIDFEVDHFDDFNSAAIIPDAGHAIGRMADVGYASEAVRSALITATRLRREGGYRFSSEIDFSSSLEPLSSADLPEYLQIVSDGLSNHDHISFWGHGSPAGFWDYNYNLMLNLSELAVGIGNGTINLRAHNPIITAWNPCYGGELPLNSSSWATELIAYGAAAYIGNTAANGFNGVVVDYFLNSLANGERIGEAFVMAIHHRLETYCDTGLCNTYPEPGFTTINQFNFYGDPTLKGR